MSFYHFSRYFKKAALARIKMKKILEDRKRKITVIVVIKARHT